MTDTTEQQAVTVAHDITRNPAAIWLSPICEDTAHHGEGRTWAAPSPDETCEDCGEPWVKYVRVDLASVSSASAEGDTLIDQLRAVREQIDTGELPAPYGLYRAVKRDGQGTGWDYRCTDMSLSLLDKVIARLSTPEPVPATNQAGEVFKLIERLNIWSLYSYHESHQEQARALFAEAAVTLARLTAPSARTYAEGVRDSAEVADQQRASCNREADSRCLGPERLQWRRAAEEIAMTAAAIRLLTQGKKV